VELIWRLIWLQKASASPRSSARGSHCQSTTPSARVPCRGSREALDRKPIYRRCIETSICRINAITYVSVQIGRSVPFVFTVQHLVPADKVVWVMLSWNFPYFHAAKKHYCSYAEFWNMTLPYSDVALPGLDTKQVSLVFPIGQLQINHEFRSLDRLFQCEERCDRSEDGFVCRAYSVDYSEEKPLCLLHSDDTIALGVSSLFAKPNVVYKEQEACLDRTFA